MEGAWLWTQLAYDNGNRRQMFSLDMTALSQHKQYLKIAPKSNFEKNKVFYRNIFKFRADKLSYSSL
jgi:hypothetical protein